MTLSSGASSSEEETKKCTLMSLQLERTCLHCQGPSVGDRIQYSLQEAWSDVTFLHTVAPGEEEEGLPFKLFLLKLNRGWVEPNQGFPGEELLCGGGN